MCQLKIKRARHRLNFHWRPSTSNRKVRCRRSLWMIQSASIAHISISTHSINRMLNGKKKSINKPNEAFAVVKWCEVHRSNWKFAAIVWYILLLGGADRTIHVSNSNFTLISTESAYINNLSLSLSHSVSAFLKQMLNENWIAVENCWDWHICLSWPAQTAYCTYI